MEPSVKRRCLGASHDPKLGLHELRARNDTKLKSVFESIFEKYGKDFTNSGDEIIFTEDDVAVVVDNGHIKHMSDEKDAGNEAKEPSPIPHTTKDLDHVVIPDSQDLESSDDDPLGVSEDGVRSMVSSFRQRRPASVSQKKTGHVLDRKMSIEGNGRQSFPEDCPPSGFTPRLDALSKFHNEAMVEQAWRVPPLPGDYNLEAALPSPSPSIQDESGSTRSASPPSDSVWASLRRTRKPKKYDVDAPSWTKDENKLLRHYRNSTGMTFDDIQNQFPGRTANALRQKWQILRQDGQSVPKRSPRNMWTPGEDQLLCHLKMSTDISFPNIQLAIPRHTISSLMGRWQTLRQKLDQPGAEKGSSASDSSKLPSISNPSTEDHTYRQDASNQPTPSMSPSALAECPLEGTKAGTAETQLSLTQLESAWSEPRPDNERTGEKRFPFHMVIPDSQSDQGTQRLLNQSLDSQMCLRGSISSQKRQDNDSAMRSHSSSLSVSSIDPSAVSQEAHFTRCESPENSSIACSRKRKRIDEKVEDYPQVASYPISHQSDSLISISHLDRLNSDTNGLVMAQNSKYGVNRTRESPQYINTSISSEPSNPSQKAGTAPVHRSALNGSVIMTDSSQDSQTGPAEAYLQILEFSNFIPTDSSSSASTTRDHGQSVMPETGDSCDNEILQSPNSTYEMDNKPNPVRNIAMDQWPVHAGRDKHPDSDSEHQMPSLEHADTSVCEEDWHLSSTHTQSRETARSERLAESLMVDMSGCTQSPPVHQFSEAFLLPVQESRWAHLISPHRSFGGEEPMQIGTQTSLANDIPSRTVATNDFRSGFTDSNDNIAEPLDVRFVLNELETSPHEHAKIDKLVEDCGGKDAARVAKHCQRFHRVEIPISSPTIADSQCTASPTPHHNLESHGLGSTRSPSKDEVIAAASQECIQEPGSGQGHVSSSNVEIVEEHRYHEPQIQHYDKESNLLGPAVERPEAEEIERPRSKIPSHPPEDLTATNDCPLAATDTPFHIPSPEQDQFVTTEDEEDDLQTLPEPAITPSLQKPSRQNQNQKGRQQVCQMRIDDMDMSEDELSTPVQVVLKQIEMTPVRPLMANRQRLSCLPGSISQ
ncbi:MAG: hypothetical protein Q9170_000478 [Blastenia crenularia]